jgi:predicted heme/steroid binding protein
MNIPDRIVTQMELRRNSGDRGSQKWIAFDGVVYDVTDCPKWRADMHEQLHFPDAPHQDDVFSRPCVKVIGRLQTE